MGQSDNPFARPVPRGLRPIQATLRVVVTIQAWGYALQRLHWGRGYPLPALLQERFHLADEQVVPFDDAAAYMLATIGVVTLVRPCWFTSLLFGTWLLAQYLAVGIAAGQPLGWLPLAINGVGIFVPTALLIFDFWPPRVKPTIATCFIAIGLLRLTTALSLIAFGIEALHQFRSGGEFITMLVAIAEKTIHVSLPERTAGHLLVAVGLISIAAASSLLTARSRALLVMIILGSLLVVAAPTLAYGVAGYDRTLRGIASVGGPTVILMFWLFAVQEQRPQVLAESED